MRMFIIMCNLTSLILIACILCELRTIRDKELTCTIEQPEIKQMSLKEIEELDIPSKLAYTKG